MPPGCFTRVTDSKFLWEFSEFIPLNWLNCLNYISHCTSQLLHVKRVDTKAKEPLNTANQADIAQEADLWIKMFVFAHITEGKEQLFHIIIIGEKKNSTFYLQKRLYL